MEWLVVAVACVGFAFDLYETLMMALLVRPAIGELSGLKPGNPAFNLWVGLLFYIPNVAAGIFGLLGGYFADLFGRRRILVWSILLYSAVGLRSRFLHVALTAIVLSLRDADWCFRGVCGCHGVAC